MFHSVDPKVLNAAAHTMYTANGNSTGMYAETKCLGEGIALVCVSANDLRWNTTGRGCNRPIAEQHHGRAAHAAWGGCESGWYAILVSHTMHQGGQSIGETWFNYIIGQLQATSWPN
jgi:hypothetical protein